MMGELFSYLWNLVETGGNGYFGIILGFPVAYIVSFILCSLILFLPFGLVIRIIKGVFDT